MTLGLVASVTVAQPTSVRNAIFAEPLSPRIANYDISVTLDDQTKSLTGDVLLRWRNTADHPVDELRFHLYYNAFHNTKSTLTREFLHSRAIGGNALDEDDVSLGEDDGWGWIRVHRMIVDGVDASSDMRYIDPDGANADDKTVLAVRLMKPIPAGGTAEINIGFESRIPKCHTRTGWWGEDFFFIAHWFPKIGVLETPGMRFVPDDAERSRWNCHSFHAGTEFYSDFGVYDVRITLPSRYVVGTTGLIVEQNDNGDGTKTVVAHAEDVHEFAWVADAQFQEATDVWKSPTDGRQIAIRLLYQPGHERVVDRYLQALKGALTHIDGWLGPRAYPYPNVTIVDPRRGSGAGGMEYPTLFTGGARWWTDAVFRGGVRMVEMVTIHEFMHQIWYGVVASNEFEEAWLDEGFTTYSEHRISNELYGERTSGINWWGITASGRGIQRGSYAWSRNIRDSTLAHPTFDQWTIGVGFNLSYSKTSLMLATLENYLGHERFDAVMRTYYERWRFRHPCRADFIAVADEVAGENLDWFFDQAIHGDVVLDYAVASIANVPVELLELGLSAYDHRTVERDDDDGVTEDEPEEEADESTDDETPEMYESTVVFRRVGDFVFPVETLIEFSDGHIERGQWDGRDRIQRHRFNRPAKVTRAAVDPDFKVWLDVDLLNNSRIVDPDAQLENKYTAKGLFWMQSLLQWFSVMG